MSDCCCPGANLSQSPAVPCPASATPGKSVDLQTVKSLLVPSALRRLTPGAHYFCPEAACDVVYFDAAGAMYRRPDLRLGVWQKEPFGARTICYCFAETEAGIRAEIELTGTSAAVARVRQHIDAGRCACELHNPRGTCCLGDVTAAVARVRESFVPASAT